jgi:hypothetical protein
MASWKDLGIAASGGFILAMGLWDLVGEPLMTWTRKTLKLNEAIVTNFGMPVVGILGGSGLMLPLRIGYLRWQGKFWDALTTEEILQDLDALDYGEEDYEEGPAESMEDDSSFVSIELDSVASESIRRRPTPGERRHRHHNRYPRDFCSFIAKVVKCELGTPVNNPANRVVVRELVCRAMKKYGHRPSHIERDMYRAIRLVFTPSAREIADAVFESHPDHAIRRLLMSQTMAN